MLQLEKYGTFIKHGHDCSACLKFYTDFQYHFLYTK